ncbi:hypothetical protein ANCDUO_16859, partial [Ancylostoma duodenale]
TPFGRRVVFTDTIGFLSDLPMHLLAAFQATLSHVNLADVIIHIRDMSNPDWPAQNEDVDKTLESIGLSQSRISDIIIADNKVDVEGAAASSTPGAIRISCKTSEGVDDLIEKVDEPILSLDLKCNMVGVTKFAPSDPETHRWFLKLFDIGLDYLEIPCFIDHIIKEVLEVPGSRGEANLVEKCKLCNRVNTVGGL